jgi:hypothetical protein
MIRKALMFLGFAVMFQIAKPAHAQFSSTGNYLLEACQITVRVTDNPGTTLGIYDAWRDGYCRGIVEGVGEKSPATCQPNDVTFGQEVRVVVKYLQDHPEKLNLRSSTLVELALSSAFPCSK